MCLNIYDLAISYDARVLIIPHTCDFIIVAIYDICVLTHVAASYDTRVSNIPHTSYVIIVPVAHILIMLIHT